jgi:thiosulfate dehydrogenase
MQWQRFIALCLFISLCLLTLLAFAILHYMNSPWPELPPNKSQKSANQQATHAARFDLLDPEMAPPSIKPLVMQGYHLMLETHKYAPDYAGDRLSCTNCHFAGGNSLGGMRNGFSLVGVVKTYPRKLENDTELTLKERINACFMKSLNGIPLPLDSQEMQSLMAYLEWISQDVSTFSTFPWLGVKPLRSQHIPDPEEGAKSYEIYCSICHGSDGQGQQRPYDLSYPPLWGEHSFNDAAGMNKLMTMASFLYDNMPYKDLGLTVEEALDIASFVINQPRPHFEPDR